MNNLQGVDVSVHSSLVDVIDNTFPSCDPGPMILDKIVFSDEVPTHAKVSLTVLVCGELCHHFVLVPLEDDVMSLFGWIRGDGLWDGY